VLTNGEEGTPHNRRATQCKEGAGMSHISRALYYEEQKQVVLFHTAPLPPDCTLISENSTSQGEDDNHVLLDQVCPMCISNGDDNVTLYLAMVEDVCVALKRQMKMALSWSHARCAGQRYLIEFSPDTNSVSLTDPRGILMNTTIIPGTYISM
jgi:hypothetical protein